MRFGSPREALAQLLEAKPSPASSTSPSARSPNGTLRVPVYDSSDWFVALHTQHAVQALAPSKLLPSIAPVGAAAVAVRARSAHVLSRSTIGLCARRGSQQPPRLLTPLSPTAGGRRMGLPSVSFPDTLSCNAPYFV